MAGQGGMLVKGLPCGLVIRITRDNSCKAVSGNKDCLNDQTHYFLTVKTPNITGQYKINQYGEKSECLFREGLELVSTRGVGLGKEEGKAKVKKGGAI